MNKMLAIRIPSVALLIVVVAVSIGSIQVAHTEDVKHGSNRATKRLMRELKGFYDSDSYKNGVFTAELVDGNITEWNVKVFKFDPDSGFYKSLMRMKEKSGKDHVMFSLKFPDNYPFSPPFVRVAYPFIQGGNVLRGGTICMEILSEKYWSSAYTIEPLILQIVAHMSKNGVVSDSSGFSPYTYENAKSTFDRISEIHGWKEE